MRTLNPGYVLLEGNPLNPTKTHTVPFIVWQRIYNQLSEQIRLDPDIMEECRSSTGFSCRSMSDACKAMMSEDTAEWMPLLSKVMTSVEFGDSLVKAMTE